MQGERDPQPTALEVLHPDDVEVIPVWTLARERIFIALRPLGFFHTPGAERVVARRSLPLLAECVVLDGAGAITYVSIDAIEEWGVPVEEVFDVARKNLGTKLEHLLEPVGEAEPPRLFRCSSGDAFESSRLVSLPLLDEMRRALGAGAIYCAAPDRDTLLLATDAAPDTILRLANAAEAAYRESTHPVAPSLYVFTEEGDLGPLELVDDHPVRERVRRGHLLLADAEYGAQKVALEEQIAEEGAELFVASHFAVERDEGLVFSYATWNEGVEVLLPVVDLIVFAFADPERPPLVVPWEVVDALGGDAWEEVEQLDPRRRRTTRFPDDEAIAAMAQYAVEL